MTWQIIHADVLDGLAQLPDASVQTVITSPPYWGLRDYGTATWEGGDAACDHLKPFDARSHATTGFNIARDPTKAQTNIGHKHEAYRTTCGKCHAVRIDSQLGLEPTPEAYVERMVAVFREVRRVLRRDGTVWMNLGDSYISGQGGRQSANGEFPSTSRFDRPDPKERPDLPNPPAGWAERAVTRRTYPASDSGYKPKDLAGMPWRVAFALQADGWYLRSDIIWSKPNPMPESVTDRPTKAHEYVFLLTRSARYFYDADAVRETALDTGGNGSFAGRQGGHERYADVLTGGFGTEDRQPHGAGRNLRSVWSIPTEPFPEAHFATFPKALVVPCVKAGTSEKGCCAECGAAFVRTTTSATANGSGSGRAGNLPEGKGHPTTQIRDGHDIRMGPITTTTTTGWVPGCTHHEADVVPCTVLDPFAGSGTVGVVALRYGRSFVGIELNPDYAEMARERIRNDAPLFNIPAEVTI